MQSVSSSQQVTTPQPHAFPFSIRALVDELYDDLVFKDGSPSTEHRVLDLVSSADYDTLVMVADAVPHIGARLALVDHWLQFLQQNQYQDWVVGRASGRETRVQVVKLKLSRAMLVDVLLVDEWVAHDDELLKQHVARLVVERRVDRSLFHPVYVVDPIVSRCRVMPLIRVPKVVVAQQSPRPDTDVKYDD
jgi:MinD-like ATPase involved in chromosome partitioning or flagellar assembly